MRVLKLTQRIKDPYALWLVLRDPRTPAYIRALAVGLIVLMCVYIISPIDIVPDYIPIAGWLDDVIIVPLVFVLLQRFVPQPIMAENREKANISINRIVLRVALIIVAIFAVCLALLGTAAFLIYRAIAG